MKGRQTLPPQWLIVDGPRTDELWRSIRRLSRGSGILVLSRLSAKERRRLRHLAVARRLTIVDESGGGVARVHDLRELRRAMLRRIPLIFLSPIHPTHSHPGWSPVPRMRAATLARLGHRRLFALGGMDADRFRRVERLGFQGWAGISAFRT